MGVLAPYGQVEISLPPIRVVSSRENDGSAILRLCLIPAPRKSHLYKKREGKEGIPMGTTGRGTASGGIREVREGG